MNRRVVIVGGGFAGIRLAGELERRIPDDWEIVLLTKENFITYNPLLPEVVGASLLPGHVVAPLRQMVKRTQVRMVSVTDIDPVERTVAYAGEGSGVVAFDHLVIACGQVANLDLVRGMEKFALPLKTLGDALFLRNRVIVRLEHADLQPNVEARRWLTGFVVLGGGFSGVEVAGGLIDFLNGALRYYPRIARDDVKVQLVHSGDHLLPELSASLGDVAQRRLEMRGVEVILNARAARVDDRAVQLSNGEVLSAGTVICTIGSAPNPLLAQLSVNRIKGRIEVAPDMSVPGHPGLWAIGDCAAVPNLRDGTISPPTAQFADRQGRQLARNIAARIAGSTTRPFNYRPQGQLSSVGHNSAVAELSGVRIGGFVAWLLWRGIYLMKIPTLGRKMRLFLEWNWAMFFPPDIAHLGFNRTRRAGRAVTVSEPNVPARAVEMKVG
ncbi:MAG: NAD(P)/FAD-dependent oxidoreductase [Gammaproteobacteria bacterium]|nr:NAD(P)/FAD-dependent oxidoreductase [Gammaproteobacteria bacterium]